jgi:hypothetical protein
VIPLLPRLDPRRCGFALTGERCLEAHWTTHDRDRLLLLANLGTAPAGKSPPPPGKIIYTTGGTATQALSSPWSATWLLATDAAGDART